MTAEHHRGLRCSADRHIWRLGALPLAIYVKIAALTCGKGNRYFSSKLNLQEFFGASEKGVYDAFLELERTGWLTRETSLIETTFRPKNYLLVTHDEWVLTHDAAACAQPDVMPWDADQKENEQLVKQLYAASDGGRWYREMIVSLRQTGLTDDQIVKEWRQFFEAETVKRGRAPKHIGFKWTFVKVMKQLAEPVK